MMVHTRSLAALAFLTFFVPYTVLGAGIFNGTIVPRGVCLCPGSAPSWGCILQLIQNVMNAMVGIGILLCVIWIAYAGFSMMTSGGVAEARSLAKTRLLNAVIGIVVILSAWLMIDFVMKFIYEPNVIFDGYVLGPWNEILSSTGDDQCLQPTTPSGLSSGFVGIAFTSQPGISGGSSGGGVCAVQSAGPCAQANLVSYFGSAASQASQICSAESCNGSCLRGDKTDQGNPVSFGLFQINITAHKVGGLNCPAAFDSVFTGSHKNVRIVNAELYRQCQTAALNPATNTQYAASLYKKDGNSWREWSTGKKCSLAYTDRLKFAVTQLIQTYE